MFPNVLLRCYKLFVQFHLIVKYILVLMSYLLLRKVEQKDLNQFSKKLNC